ncbi:hypothetical protein C8F01DRAFT_177667 [Mycena amicta]|nr:hypothetical protein C8F01DRAFT_177667 [Mycena amicta]
MSPLPPELLERIAALIPDADKDSLRAASLAGSAFVSPSQRALFRNLRLVYSGVHAEGGAPISLMHTILSMSPHLASYVHELTVVISTEREPHDHSAFISVLSRVQRLKHLALGGETTCRTRIQPLPHDVVAALLDCLTRLSLLRCSLVYLRDPPPVLLLAAMVAPAVLFNNVWLSQTWLENLTSVWMPELPPPRIVALATTQFNFLDCIFAFLVSSAGQSYLKEIRVLDLQSDNGMPPEIDKILSVCAGTLERFTDASLRPLVVPRVLPHLHTLEIRVVMVQNGTFPSHLLTNLSNFASSAPLLRTITFKLLLVRGLRRFCDDADKGIPVSPLEPFGLDFPNRPAHLLGHLELVECIPINFDQQKVGKWMARFSSAMKAWMPGLETESGKPLLVCSRLDTSSLD